MKPLDERIFVWIAALEAGYLSVNELVRWADDEICRSAAAPPPWLPDLCLAQSRDEAEQLLWPAWSRHQERDPACIARAADMRLLALGFLWLNFERGGMALVDVLRVAVGINRSHGFEDETFALLGLIDDLQYGRLGNGPADVKAEARQRFEDAPQIARERLGDLPNVGP